MQKVTFVYSFFGLCFICVCLSFPSLCFHWSLSLLWDGSCLSLALEFSITSKTILKLDCGLDFGMNSTTYRYKLTGHSGLPIIQFLITSSLELKWRPRLWQSCFATMLQGACSPSCCCIVDYSLSWSVHFVELSILCCLWQLSLRSMFNYAVSNFTESRLQKSKWKHSRWEDRCFPMGYRQFS